MYDGPLGSKLPHLPIDYLHVVNDLNHPNGQLKKDWAKEMVKKAAPVLRYASAAISPCEKPSSKGGLFQLFGETSAFRNVW